MSDGADQAMLDMFSLVEMPGHLLRRAHQRSFDIFTRIVGDDVTRQQIALLIALYQNPASSQKTLVTATGIDKGTLREMLSRMVKRGWVVRDRHPADARAWAMDVTPAGVALLKDRIAKVVQAQDEILSPLPEPLRPVFLQCLRVLIGHECTLKSCDTGNIYATLGDATDDGTPSVTG